jgi:putative ABC transport system ATP-binding protein
MGELGSRDVICTLETQDVVLEREGRAFALLPSLRLKSGQVAALTGASGSGKTTALLALSGVRAPQQGRIAIENIDLWSLGRAQRDRLRGRRIGLVFQSFHLIDAVSVEDNLRLAATCAGLVPDESRIGTLLECLDIAALRRRRADQLSQGEAQRTAVARALVNKPAVILADEPTSALDDGNAKALLDLLSGMTRDQGAALLIATHDRRVLDTVDFFIAMGASR